MKFYTIRLTIGIVVYLLFVYLLYIKFFSTAIIVFTFSFMLIATAFQNKLSMKIRQRSSQPIKLPIKPFLFIWLIPALFGVGMGVGLYFKNGFILAMSASICTITIVVADAIDKWKMLDLLERENEEE